MRDCRVLGVGLTVFEGAEKREADKRKRQRNSDASDVEGYLGPWGKFVDEKTVMKPSEVLFPSLLLICFQLLVDVRYADS